MRSECHPWTRLWSMRSVARHGLCDLRSMGVLSGYTRYFSRDGRTSNSGGGSIKTCEDGRYIQDPQVVSMNLLHRSWRCCASRGASGTHHTRKRRK